MALRRSLALQVKRLASLAEVKTAFGENSKLAIDFTAVWCPPCKKIGPVFEKMSEDPANKDIAFFKVDVDEAGDVAAQHGISAMPTFQFFNKGEKQSELVGASEDGLKDRLEKLAKA